MQKMFVRILALCVCLLMGINASAQPGKPSLRGSLASVARMTKQAKDHKLVYMGSEREIRDFVRIKRLVKLGGNRNYKVDDEVSYPFVLPSTNLFVDRLTAQSRVACKDDDDVLVVTSATRPTNERPPNGSKRSVHPTGMAIDFRRPENRRCREWLEEALLSLERRGLGEVTLESSLRWGPHCHFAVFPNQYTKYVESLTAPKKPAPKKSASPPPKKTPPKKVPPRKLAPANKK